MTDRDKAQRGVFEGLRNCRRRLPFRVLGRISTKNDNCYVEQKDWSVVRRAVGYRGYDTSGELDTLNALYDQLRLLINYFTPQAKLIAKSRDGAKVTKRYDTPKTPYQRLTAHPGVDAVTKINAQKEVRAPRASGHSR